MHYLDSNSCHVIGCHISIMEYICAVPRQLLLAQTVPGTDITISESLRRVYRKWGSNVSGRTSIFDVSYD